MRFAAHLFVKERRQQLLARHQRLLAWQKLEPERRQHVLERREQALEPPEQAAEAWQRAERRCRIRVWLRLKFESVLGYVREHDGGRAEKPLCELLDQILVSGPDFVATRELSRSDMLSIKTLDALVRVYTRLSKASSELRYVRAYQQRLEVWAVLKLYFDSHCLFTLRVFEDFDVISIARDDLDLSIEHIPKG